MNHLSGFRDRLTTTILFVRLMSSIDSKPRTAEIAAVLTTVCWMDIIGLIQVSTTARRLPWSTSSPPSWTSAWRSPRITSRTCFPWWRTCWCFYCVESTQTSMRRDWTWLPRLTFPTSPFRPFLSAGALLSGKISATAYFTWNILS